MRKAGQKAGMSEAGPCCIKDMSGGMMQSEALVDLFPCEGFGDALVCR